VIDTTSYQFILAMLLYVFIATSLISITAVGMGYSPIGTLDSEDFSSPDGTTSSDIPIIGGFVDWLNDVGAAAGFVGALMVIMATVLLWSVPEVILPLWANIIFIKIPLVALIASLVEMFLP